MIVVPDVAEKPLLNVLLDGVVPLYRLFVNNYTPNAATVLANFVEASWPDYAARAVTNWVLAVTQSGRAVAVADPQLWTRGAGGSPALVYGYYVTDGMTGPLLWCERRPAGPIPMILPTDALEVLPSLTLREDPEPIE